MRFLAAMNHVYAVAKKSTKTPGERHQTRHPPWTDRIDADIEKDDTIRAEAHGIAMAPYLFIYFDNNYAFEGGIVCTDTKEIRVKSCVTNCFVVFLALFEIFQIGFNPQWYDVLAFMEHALLEMEFKTNSPQPGMGVLELIRDFDNRMKKSENEGGQHCV